MIHAPVALFVYNRPDHTKRTVEALAANVLAAQTDVVVFSDGPKAEADAAAVREVREVVKLGWGFRSIEVVAAEQNRGLASSIIGGVTRMLEKHERVIVFEDDLVTASGTLGYFNAGLDFYRDEQAVFSISAYSHPPSVMQLPRDYDYDAYCIPRVMCWGWATWRDRWAKADWEVEDYGRFLASPSAQRTYAHLIGKDCLGTLKACMSGEKDVWACRWVHTHFKHRAVCVCPTVSYVDNIGLDGSGANCGANTRLRNDLSGSYPREPRFPEHVFVDPGVLAAFMNVYDGRLRRATPTTAPAQRPALRARIRNFLAKNAERLLVRLTRKHRKPVVRLGTQYGGWHVLEGALGTNDVVISAGVGEDISFDVELVRRTGCQIYLLDPTPRAVEHFDSTCRLIGEGRCAPINNSRDEFYTVDSASMARLTFLPFGLWNRDCTTRFYEPKDGRHVSHSIQNLQGTSKYFEAKCVTLRSLMKREGVEKLGAVKMDIEGAEFAVLRNMLASWIRPKLLMVEFHPGNSKVEREGKIKTILHVLMLRLCGYHLIVRDGWDLVFVRSDQLVNTSQKYLKF